MVPENRRQRQERSMRTVKRTVLMTVVLAALAAAAAWGQSNDVLDSLLAEKRATLGRAAYLVLTAAGGVEENQTVEQAFAALKAKPWGFSAASPQDPLTLGSYASMVMRAFGMRGGLLYSLFPGKRYAAREFAYRGFVQGNTSPGRALSGRDATHVLGQVLEALGQRTAGEETK